MIKSINLGVISLVAILGSSGLPQVAQAVGPGTENLDGISAESQKALQEDAQGRTTIPYTRLWDQRANEPTLYARASSSLYGYPYMGPGTGGASFYERAPVNWRLIQTGSERLLKNSLTGKCLSINTTPAINMKTCNTSDPTQRLRVRKIDNYSSQTVVYRQTSLDSFYLSYFSFDNGAPLQVGFDADFHPPTWYSVNLR